MSWENHHHRGRYFVRRSGSHLGLALLCTLVACSSGGDGGDAGGGGGGGGGGPVGRPGALRIDPVFGVTNHHASTRTETVRASIPFPRGMVLTLEAFTVEGHQTAWMPMQHWPDGSVRIAQAQFTDTIGGGETMTYKVLEGGDLGQGSGNLDPFWVRR